MHPDKAKLKIKPPVFNTAGVIDEDNTPTVAVSEESGGESEHSETECEPSDASKNSGKETGFYFSDLDLFAFNLMYLGQNLSVKVTRNIAVFGMVPAKPIFKFIST